MIGRWPLGDDVAFGPEKLKLHDEASLSGEVKLLKGFEESYIVVSKSESEKFGMPHFVHSQETFLRPANTVSGIAMHAWWYQTLHVSQHTLGNLWSFIHLLTYYYLNVDKLY